MASFKQPISPILTRWPWKGVAKWPWDSIPSELEDLPRTIIPLSGGGVLGIAALRSLGEPVTKTGHRPQCLNAALSGEQKEESGVDQPDTKKPYAKAYRLVEMLDDLPRRIMV